MAVAAIQRLARANAADRGARLEKRQRAMKAQIAAGGRHIADPKSMPPPARADHSALCPGVIPRRNSLSICRSRSTCVGARVRARNLIPVFVSRAASAALRLASRARPRLRPGRDNSRARARAGRGRKSAGLRRADRHRQRGRLQCRASARAGDRHDREDRLDRGTDRASRQTDRAAPSAAVVLLVCGSGWM
jgi:hypothetical protein